MTMAPGTMVSAPAAASRPSSYPDALAVRVMIAAIGLAATDVSAWASRDFTQDKALGDVVANEIDADGAGHDGRRSSRGEQSELISRRARRPRHDRGNRLGGDGGQRLGEQQLHPGEHEAEEGGDADARCD